MKILKRIGKAAATVLKTVEKKAGLHVYRPVVNAQKWADWMQKNGVPNAKSAEELRVTIFKATGKVNIVPDQHSHVIRSTTAVFAEHGVNGLAIIWYDYLYYDRHWTLRELTPSEICSCAGRAVLVLSDDIGDFELTDEMLETVPASIVLDGEKSESLTGDDVEVTKSAATAETVTFTDAQKIKAAAALAASFDEVEQDPMQQAALYEISRGHPVLKSALADLGALAPEFGGEAPETEPEPAETEVEGEKTKSRLVKKSDARRILYGWASVATHNGETVVDYADDEITVDALHDIAHLVVKGARQGALEHNGGSSGEIVEALVFDKDLCKALSAFSLNGPIELDREAVLIGMHYPDDDEWQDAQAHDWELSINATVKVAEREAA